MAINLEELFTCHVFFLHFSLDSYIFVVNILVVLQMHSAWLWFSSYVIYGLYKVFVCGCIFTLQYMSFLLIASSGKHMSSSGYNTVHAQLLAVLIQVTFSHNS